MSVSSSPILKQTHISKTLLDDLLSEICFDRKDPEMLPVTAPFTGEEIGRIPSCSEADMDEAMLRARRAQIAWSAVSSTERRKILLRFHDLVLKRQDLLLDMIQLETGKARLNAFEEVLDVAISSRYYAIHGENHLKAKRRRGAFPLLTRTMEYRHPVGVVGIISPWNYPLSLAISDALPALFAGNAVILKPDHRTSFTALLGFKLLREAGLPSDAMQIITGDGGKVGPHLLDSVDMISYTGSTATGRQIAEQAGRRLVHCSLELGGKNPLLILNDADIRRGVEGAIRGCFANSGQLCMSFERLYVQDEIYDRFVGAFSERTGKLQLGKGFDFDADMGSLSSARQLATVSDHVRDAVAKGAQLLTGGKARPDLGPYFFEPTILVGVKPGMTVYREETFGPVVSIYRFREIEDGVGMANDSDYGLNAGIWTGNVRKGCAVGASLRCGTVNINESYAAAWGSVDAPVGGMKNSGLGRRHGSEGILKYTEAQTIALQRLLPIGPLPGMPLHRYARQMTEILSLLRRIPGLR